ncbi:hypothetical protein GCM10020221_20270 [Streptomyces thioluteus]|uniref:Uncharacterized protein n=1 Tax=Streptomyces thioluteus TaxID=66431 RepID=A0ABN3WPY5_STRTU
MPVTRSATAEVKLESISHAVQGRVEVGDLDRVLARAGGDAAVQRDLDLVELLAGDLGQEGESLDGDVRCAGHALAVAYLLRDLLLRVPDRRPVGGHEQARQDHGDDQQGAYGAHRVTIPQVRLAHLPFGEPNREPGETRQNSIRPTTYTAGEASASGRATPAVMWTKRDG